MPLADILFHLNSPLQPNTEHSGPARLPAKVGENIDHLAIHSLCNTESAAAHGCGIKWRMCPTCIPIFMGINRNWGDLAAQTKAGTSYFDFNHGNTKPPRQARMETNFFARANSESSRMGSPTPCGKSSWPNNRNSIARYSATQHEHHWRSFPTGIVTFLILKYSQALSKAAWSETGTISSGFLMPFVCKARSR